MKYQMSALAIIALTGCVSAETTVVAEPAPIVEEAAVHEKIAKPTTTPAGANIVQPSPVSIVLDEGEEKTETEKLQRKADFAEAMSMVEDRQRVFKNTGTSYSLDGTFAQGGLVFGQAAPGATVRLDGDAVMVDDEGRFVFGFGRDSALSALLTVTSPNGETERQSLEVEDREFKVQRIDNLDQSKVSGFTQEQLAKIGEDSAKKKKARSETEKSALWAVGFEWPVTGRISGVFGSQRILNGEPKRPHSGVDIARPTGTPIKAPADGVIRLAEEGMYFEGGLVLLDHGHWLESAFLHMSRIDVEPGQQIKKGDVIGAIGSTGRSTGPHLHWSVKWAGRLVDPQLLVGEMPSETTDGL